MEKYDVVIAGAGIAGASAAYFISRKGFKVLLADVKPFHRAGDKPCGDAIGKHHLDELGIEYPRNGELEGLVRGIDVYSPSEGMKYRVLGEGFEVNRVAFTQRFIRLAIDNGAEYFQETQVKDPVIKDGIVKGAVLWSRRKGSWEVSTNLLVDATGMSRALIRKLPREWPIRDELNPTEMNVAYREIRELKKDIEEPEILRIYVSKDKAPGGYWWFFPYSMEPHTVNIGLGVQGGRGYPHPKDLLYTKVLNRAELRESKVIESGGAAVPTRRPINTLVWNGIAAIGDSAYTVNPIHGGGKGSAMLSAWCLSHALEEAQGKWDNDALWEVNKCYMSRYGAKQAALDVFRMFLQELSDEELEYGMRKKLIKEEDLNTVSLKGDLELGIVDKAMRLLAGLRRPSLLLQLKIVADYMGKVKDAYMNYPQKSKGLKAWVSRVDDLFSEYRARLYKK